MMKCLFVALGGLLAFAADAAVGPWDADVSDFPRRSGETGDSARILRAVEAAGAFAVTLECIPSELAAEITAAVRIPTIGIGAGPVCDAQWLVMHDLLGLNEGHVPSFVKQYAHLAETAKAAFAQYVAEVADGTFPSA